MSNSDVICESGYPKPLMNTTLADKDEIIRSVFLHQTIYRCLAELDQLKKGLNVLGMTDEMTKHPDVFFDFFTSINKKKLTAGLYSYMHHSNLYIFVDITDYVQKLFEPVEFSGENTDEKEASYMHFTRLLNEAEGMLLLFCTWFLTIS